MTIPEKWSLTVSGPFTEVPTIVTELKVLVFWKSGLLWEVVARGGGPPIYNLYRYVPL